MENTPVRLDKIIARLAQLEAVSDIHLEEGNGAWVRTNGELAFVPLAEPLAAEVFLTFFKFKARDTGLSIEDVEKELRNKGDVDVGFSVDGMRFRGNLFRANSKKLSLALRKIPVNVPALEGLSLPRAYLDSIRQSKGLVLVTGATGSGKSTTLAATLEHLNQTSDGHIVTLEDPVEYVLHSKRCLVHQRQVKRDAIDFKGSLRAALRQDPDIIYVGELRDHDTVKTALDAANTGHLVFGTLHTMSARQTVERLMSFFPPETQGSIAASLSQVLLCVLSQSLLRRVDGKGRALACELLVNTPSVRAALRDNKPAAVFSAMDTGIKEGQVLLNRSLKSLVQSNVVSRDEALYFAYDPAPLAKELGGAK